MKRCSILLVIVCVCTQSLQLCLTPCNPVDCSLSGSCDHVILQAGILERVAMPFPSGLDGKAFACNTRDPGLIPGSGRSPGDLPSPLEKEMANHSSILAWKIPWLEEPDRLQSMGQQRVPLRDD